MPNDPIEVRAVSAPWHRGVSLLVRQGGMVGVNVEMKTAPEGIRVEPTFGIDIDSAQTLMDDLWHAGLRPTEGSGSAGSLRATERHLADMRKIALSQLSLDVE